MYRILSFFITFFISTVSLFAVDDTIIIAPPGVIDATPVSLISGIISYAIGVAAILGVIGMTWGGIEMVLSTGEDEKLKKGKYIMIYSVLGVIIAGLAYSVVNIIGNLRI